MLEFLLSLILVPSAMLLLFLWKVWKTR